MSFFPLIKRITLGTSGITTLRAIYIFKGTDRTSQSIFRGERNFCSFSGFRSHPEENYNREGWKKVQRSKKREGHL